ncbi:MAG: hypothetical protein HEP69_05350 [Aestuariivita sp.]|nr:hypothetical protein [Aestuariivita sp.]MCE8006429.1 hypothetical protein [Aestuariivita sp.]
MRALVVEDRVAIASLETLLAAAINNTAASLKSEQLVRSEADDALAQDIVTVKASLESAEGDIAANATATSDLAVRTTAAEGAITSQGQSIDTLQAGLTTAQGNIAANATATNNLAVRTTAAEGAITSQGQSIDTLQAGLTTAQGNIAANATATSDLAVRTTAAEGAITSQGQSIDTLQAGLTTAQGNIAANATATSGLTVRTTDAENQLASQATQLTSLTSTVGAQSTTIQSQQTSIDGIEAEYALRIDNNGVVSGVVVRSDLDNAGVPTTAAVYQVDKFSIIAPGDPSASSICNAWPSGGGRTGSLVWQPEGRSSRCRDWSLFWMPRMRGWMVWSSKTWTGPSWCGAMTVPVLCSTSIHLIGAGKTITARISSKDPITPGWLPNWPTSRARSCSPSMTGPKRALCLRHLRSRLCR